MSNQLATYKIKEWVVLGRVFFKPPSKASDTLINEARIVHVVNGDSNLYTANQNEKLTTGDTLIMKSDNFINNWSPNESESLNEVIVFQLTSDMLKEIYQNQLPKWHSANSPHQVPPIHKLRDNFLLDRFFETLRHYFDNPQLITENLIQIKIKELLHILIRTDSNGKNRLILGALFKSNEYEFQKVIQTHLFDNLNLEDFAFSYGFKFVVI